MPADRHTTATAAYNCSTRLFPHGHPSLRGDVPLGATFPSGRLCLNRPPRSRVLPTARPASAGVCPGADIGLRTTTWWFSPPQSKPHHPSLRGDVPLGATFPSGRLRAAPSFPHGQPFLARRVPTLAGYQSLARVHTLTGFSLARAAQSEIWRHTPPQSEPRPQGLSFTRRSSTPSRRSHSQQPPNPGTGDTRRHNQSRTLSNYLSLAVTTRTAASQSS